MNHSRTRLNLAVILLILGGVCTAVAQEPIAVITELKFNRGNIYLRSIVGKAPTKPGILQSLYAGNIVETTRDAKAMILFADGSRTVVVDDTKNPRFEVVNLPLSSSSVGLGKPSVR